MGAERCKNQAPQGFQVKLDMIILAYPLQLKLAKTVLPQTLRYPIGYHVTAK